MTRKTDKPSNKPQVIEATEGSFAFPGVTPTAGICCAIAMTLSSRQLANASFGEVGVFRVEEDQFDGCPTRALKLNANLARCSRLSRSSSSSRLAVVRFVILIKIKVARPTFL